jgi:transportin-3
MPNSNLEAKLFAAQTFRQKIEYDFEDLDGPSQGQLRDSLLELLHGFNGQKNIVTQLCIALADLAIQMSCWENPVGLMLNTFGSTELMPILLEFLSVLPEELSYNTKINLDVRYI